MSGCAMDAAEIGGEALAATVTSPSPSGSPGGSSTPPTPPTPPASCSGCDCPDYTDPGESAQAASTSTSTSSASTPSPSSSSSPSAGQPPAKSACRGGEDWVDNGSTGSPCRCALPMTWRTTLEVTNRNGTKTTTRQCKDWSACPPPPPPAPTTHHWTCSCTGCVDTKFHDLPAASVTFDQLDDPSTTAGLGCCSQVTGATLVQQYGGTVSSCSHP